MKNAIIFDGDDTIWEIQPLFDDAKQKLAEIVNSKLGIDPSKTLARLDEIDLTNIAKVGFSPQRFPNSMVETFVSLSSAKGHMPSASETQQIYSIGVSIFEQTPKFLPGAEKVLATLREIFPLILYTLGDPARQKRIIDKLNLNRFFNHLIYIVPEKNSRQLQKIVKENNLPLEAIWVIGNSLRSDINPALSLGIRCIWVNIHSWAYDNRYKLSDKDSKVFEVKSLSEIPSILLENTFPPRMDPLASIKRITSFQSSRTKLL